MSDYNYGPGTLQAFDYGKNNYGIDYQTYDDPGLRKWGGGQVPVYDGQIFTLIDNSSGKVLYQGSGIDGLRQASQMSNGLKGSWSLNGSANPADASFAVPDQKWLDSQGITADQFRTLDGMTYASKGDSKFDWKLLLPALPFLAVAGAPLLGGLLAGAGGGAGVGATAAGAAGGLGGAAGAGALGAGAALSGAAGLAAGLAPITVIGATGAGLGAGALGALSAAGALGAGAALGTGSGASGAGAGAGGALPSDIVVTGAPAAGFGVGPASALAGAGGLGVSNLTAATDAAQPGPTNYGDQFYNDPAPTAEAAPTDIVVTGAPAQSLTVGAAAPAVGAGTLTAGMNLATPDTAETPTVDNNDITVQAQHLLLDPPVPPIVIPPGITDAPINGIPSIPAQAPETIDPNTITVSHPPVPPPDLGVAPPLVIDPPLGPPISIPPGVTDAPINGIPSIGDPATIPPVAPPVDPAKTDAKGKGDLLTDILKGLGLAGLLTGTVGNAVGGGNQNTKIPPGLLDGDLNDIFTKPLPAPNLPGLTVGGTTARDMPQQDWTRYGFRPEQSFFNNVPSNYTPPAPGQRDPYWDSAAQGFAVGGSVSKRADKTAKRSDKFPDGMVASGNIDIHERPVVHNRDGSISTVRSMSFGTDDGEVLVPTVSDDGRIMSDDEARDTYFRTGRHLGIFKTPDAATQYAERLHDDQAQEYGFAVGGSVKSDFAVKGPGSGRADNVPINASDGEYVMDAETVSMLGDGSNKAGADKLDQFRVKLRKHKGKNLVRGDLSVKAKAPERYMRDTR